MMYFADFMFEWSLCWVSSELKLQVCIIIAMVCIRFRLKSNCKHGARAVRLLQVRKLQIFSCRSSYGTRGSSFVVGGRHLATGVCGAKDRLRVTI